MDENSNAYQTIDDYINQYTGDIRERLTYLREVIKEAAPEASERISYQMPALFLHGVLVYFAAFKKHIGFFPTASGVIAFQDELTEYKCTKGTIQFPYNKPIPYDLVKRITQYRVTENISINEAKKKKC